MSADIYYQQFVVKPNKEEKIVLSSIENLKRKQVTKLNAIIDKKKKESGGKPNSSNKAKKKDKEEKKEESEASKDAVITTKLEILKTALKSFWAKLE